MVQMLGVRTANAVLMVFSPPPIYLTWYNPVCVLFLVTVALGLWTSLRREGMVLDCYMLSYTGMILLYPFDEGTRYLFSIHPFILLYGIDGLDELRRHGERLGARLGGVVHTTLSSRALFSAGKAVLLGAIVAAGLYQISILARQNLHPDPTKFRNATTVDVAAWVRENARDGDVIMDDQPAILHRLTGRKTLRFPLTTDPKLIAESIVANHVSVVVVLNERPFEYYNPSTMRRFGRVRELHPEWFAPVRVFDRGTIYRVRKEGDDPLSPETPL
jgi:hypothetical protein